MDVVCLSVALPWRTDAPFNQSLIVPHKAIRELQRLLDASEDIGIAFHEDEKKIFFLSGEMQLSSKLIDGNYPDYMQVIPKKFEHSLLLNRESFIASIRQVAVMASEPSRQLKLCISKDNLELSASTPDLGEAVDSLAIDYKGESLILAFNSRYLLEVLQSINAEKFVLKFGSVGTPITIKETEDGDFMAIIMPMKLS